MAALLVALFFCMPPQAYLYPAAQKCSVILPVLPASWYQPFCSFFSCAVSFYGRRRGGASSAAVAGAETGQQEEAAGGLMHKMRAHFLASRSSRRSSKFSARDRLWSFWRTPRGSQLMLLFISWSLLLLLLGMPCQVKGSSELLSGQAGYAEDWHRGSKGTDVLSQLSGITGRRYKNGEPPPVRAGEGFGGRAVDEPQWKGSVFSSRLESDNFIESNAADKARSETAGAQASKLPRNLERLHVVSLLRDCLRVKCSPLASFDGKQPLSDETPPALISKAGSPTFQDATASAPQVAINPPFLEWGSQPVYAPRVASLTVVNTCNSTRLKVFQPFSTDVQFYTLGFEEKVVDPGDELSIPIVFLPRALGVADAMLIVQTSAGGFLVQAQGRGVGSPYKVQPLQGLRVSSGETLQHTIALHNPHDEVLRVGEVSAWPSKLAESSQSELSSVKTGECGKESSTSSGVSRCVDGHPGAIEPTDPKGASGGAAVIQMWPAGQLEIGPHSSNPIAEFQFAALTADKYSGSLHIKLSRGGAQGSEDVLILPIDVQVGEAKGDASPVEPVVDVLEFGILTKEDQTSKVDVVLYNPGTEAVQVEDISLLLEDENIVYIEYKKGLVLPPKSETDVAVVTYMGIEETVPSGLFECHPRELLRDRKLIVSTNSSVSPLVEVPYRALVLHGSVDCDLARGSVGYVPQRSDGNGGAGISVPEGGALSEQRVRFGNDLSIPLPLFMDIQRIARTTNPQLPSDRECCHESSQGHLTVSLGEVSIVAHTELLYPVVQVGSEELHWVNVINPSDKPLQVQVLVSSKAEASDRSGRHVVNKDLDEGFFSASPDLKVACSLLDNPSSVFAFAEGAILEAVVEANGETTLGPVVFRPPERCQWTGLLSLWNNLTQVEWIPLQGHGGSASLTFLDGEYPVDLLQLDFNATKLSMIYGDMDDEAAVLLDANMAKALCSQRVSKGFWAKNTGDVHLDVSAVELVGGGGCSAYGFQVESCDGFSLAPGQSEELFVSYQPDSTGGIFQRDVQLITSTGIVQISLVANLPSHILPLCLGMSQSTRLEKAFLVLAIVALVVVLGVFFRMLVQEMALQQDQVSGSGLKCVPQHSKMGGRQNTPLLFTSSPAVVVPKTSSSPVIVSGRSKCSSGEPEVQSRTGDGTGASGPGRPPKESMKGLVRALKGVADSLTATMGATAGSEDNNINVSKAGIPPPADLPGLRVKIPSSAAVNGQQKSTLGSPMREASSPCNAHFRKGMTEKRSQARFDGVQVKIAPEPLEETLPAPVKQSPVPKSPKSAVSSMVEDDGENSHLRAVPSASNSVSVSGPPVTPRSPRKGNQFNQLKQGLSPKSRPNSPKSQPQAPQSSSGGTGANEKEKGKRKKRRSNVGTVKHESVSKAMSGSSSPSSPASPATPASPSRPISPLLNSETQPNLTALSTPHAFSSPKDQGSAPFNTSSPLAKLDVTVERHTSTSKTAAGTGKVKEISGPTIYRKSESLSVDVASTALREMAQAKATTDLSWTTPSSGKGNRSSDKANDVGKRGASKDWAAVARKATLETQKEIDFSDDGGWDRMTRIPQSGGQGCVSPSLTPSATFPRREDRRPEWNVTDSSMEDVQGLMKPIGSAPALVPVSTIPPAARAPGAQIARPFLDDSSGDVAGWGGTKGEYSLESSSSCGEMFEKKSDGLTRFVSGITSEDQRVYDIWGNHFGEISRCATQQIVGSVTSGLTDAAPPPLPSLAVLDATPSFFSSFPQPNFPGMDSSTAAYHSSPAVTGSITSGFSVFSQAPDIETFCLPSTLFHSPKTVPARSAVFSEVNSFGHGRNVLNAIGGSLPGSPRKPRAPYSPPLGPSSRATEFGSLAIPATTSDPSYSFWSGSTLQEVFTAPIHSRS